MRNITPQTGISDKTGWWTSLVAGDFDNDGDVDYIAGNFGQNIYFKCSSGEPLSIYAKDFDNNGLYDPFISCFWRDSSGGRKEVFYHSRDDMIKQLVSIKRKFQTYGAFVEATVKDVFTADELKGAQILKTNWLSTSYVENLGNGKFKISILPPEAQLAPIYGMMVYDVDHDGLLDIVMTGNDYGMEVFQGRADAFNGLILRNKGGGQFQTVELDQSGFYVPHDARALTRIGLASGKELILATQNRDALKVFQPKAQPMRRIPLSKNEVKAVISLKNGQKRLQEFYWGNSFLSQEPRNLITDESMLEISIFDRNNKLTRSMSPL